MQAALQPQLAAQPAPPAAPHHHQQNQNTYLWLRQVTSLLQVMLAVLSTAQYQSSIGSNSKAGFLWSNVCSSLLQDRCCSF
jgi:hypothetical protein